jgi:hypothetical protein
MAAVTMRRNNKLAFWYLVYARIGLIWFEGLRKNKDMKHIK